MKLFNGFVLSAIVFIGASLSTAPVIAGDPDDLVQLRNNWNQYRRELPTRSAETRCSGLGVMRGIANAFMDRHGDSSYAKKFNLLQSRYQCRDIAKLEFLPSSLSGDQAVIDDAALAEDGSCLKISEILAMGSEIEKQCGETYLHIRSY